jgi:hypothetical protein
MAMKRRKANLGSSPAKNVATKRTSRAVSSIEENAVSDDVELRIKAAKSLRCLPATLDKLSKDSSRDVRGTALENPKLSQSRMKEILFDFYDTRTYTNGTYPPPPSRYKDSSKGNLYSVLRNKAIPAKFLKKFVENGVTGIEFNIILGNPNCPREFIEVTLGKASEPKESKAYVSRDYYRFIAMNPNVTKSDVDALFALDLQEVDLCLIRNKNIKQEVLERLLVRYLEKKKSQNKIIRALMLRLTSLEKKQEAVNLLASRSTSHKNRDFVAAYTLDVEKAKEACLDENKGVRQRAKRNRITPQTSKALVALRDGL